MAIFPFCSLSLCVPAFLLIRSSFDVLCCVCMCTSLVMQMWTIQLDNNFYATRWGQVWSINIYLKSNVFAIAHWHSNIWQKNIIFQFGATFCFFFAIGNRWGYEPSFISFFFIFFYCRVCGMGRPFHSTRRVGMKWWSNFIEKIIALRKRERAKIRNAKNKWLFLLDSRKWFPITANQYDSRSLTTEYHKTNWCDTQIR